MNEAPRQEVNSNGDSSMPESARLGALRRAAEILGQAQAFDVLKHVQHALAREVRESVVADREGARYFRTVYTVEVLSEGEPTPGDMPLSDIGAAISFGDCVGRITFEGANELDAQEMRQAVEEVGSEPSFFQSLVEQEGYDAADGAGSAWRTRESAG